MNAAPVDPGAAIFAVGALLFFLAAALPLIKWWLR